MGPKVKWSWASAAIGAATMGATTALIVGKPKDPSFQLISVDLTSFRLKFPSLDVELIMTVHVTNPNIVPVRFASTTMSIYYDGALLGMARIEAGSQEAQSCKMMRLPARLSGVELVHHVSKFVADVAKREMVLTAVVEVEGTARVAWWDHRFKVHVDSHITVDPVFLDIIDQENKSQMDLYV